MLHRQAISCVQHIATAVKSSNYMAAVNSSPFEKKNESTAGVQYILQLFNHSDGGWGFFLMFFFCVLFLVFVGSLSCDCGKGVRDREQPTHKLDGRLVDIRVIRHCTFQQTIWQQQQQLKVVGNHEKHLNQIRLPRNFRHSATRLAVKLLAAATVALFDTHTHPCIQDHQSAGSVS